MKYRLKLDKVAEYLGNCGLSAVFFGPTDYPFLGMQRCVPNLHFVCTRKADWEGIPRNYFSPNTTNGDAAADFKSAPESLLRSDEVRSHLAALGPAIALSLTYDAAIVELAVACGLKWGHSAAEVFRHFDNKVVGTKLARDLAIPLPPNFCGMVANYEDLREKTEELGDELVVQRQLGCSGEGTYFVNSAEDWNALDLEFQPLKVTKRLNCQDLAVEACATAAGAVVGPVILEVVGIEELTPFKGGWCGDQSATPQLDSAKQAQVRSFVRQIGDAMYRSGFRGYFEVDFLYEAETGSIYFGEINPRISGAGTVSNAKIAACGLPPMLAFHLLEYSGAKLDESANELQALYGCENSREIWSQLIVKHRRAPVRLGEVPPSGVYHIDEVGRKTMQLDPFELKEREFYLSTEVESGNIVKEGQELCSLFLREPITAANGYFIHEWRRRIETLIRPKFDIWSNGD